jgi:hypothetical protein
MGQFRFDDKQNVVFTLYVTRVVDHDGLIRPDVVETMARDVDQFGNFK